MLKAKIDFNGNIHLLRRNRLKAQECPYSGNEPCTDFCPKFKEPEIICTEHPHVLLSICGTELIFGEDEFLDERE